MEQSDLVKIFGLGFFAGVCAGFFGGYLSKTERSKEPAVLDDAIQSLKEFNLMNDEVEEEKAEITKTLADFSEKALYQLAPAPKPNGLFSESLRTADEVYPGRQKRNELLRGLQELMTSYPVFDSAQCSDPDYVRRIHKEIVEHHAQTANVAELVYEELNAIICPKSSDKCVEMSR